MISSLLEESEITNKKTNNIKKTILNIIIAIVLIGITSIIWNIPKIKYDLNRDGKIDLVDVMEETKYYVNH